MFAKVSLSTSASAIPSGLVASSRTMSSKLRNMLSNFPGDIIVIPDLNEEIQPLWVTLNFDFVIV